MSEHCERLCNFPVNEIIVPKILGIREICPRNFIFYSYGISIAPPSTNISHPKKVVFIFSIFRSPAKQCYKTTTGREKLKGHSLPISWFLTIEDQKIKLKSSKHTTNYTSCFLTNMLSNLRSLWTNPCLCTNSKAFAMSFAHRIVFWSVGGVEDGNPGIFSGFWKMCFLKSSLHSSITSIALTRSPSLSSAAP